MRVETKSLEVSSGLAILFRLLLREEVHIVGQVSGDVGPEEELGVVRECFDGLQLQILGGQHGKGEMCLFNNSPKRGIFENNVYCNG